MATKANPGQGDLFYFHGAFTEKKDALKKQEETPGTFVRTAWYRSGMRYAAFDRLWPAERDVNPKRKRNALFSFPSILARRPKITSASWDRAGEQRRVRAAINAGINKKVALTFANYSWKDVATLGPEWQTKLMSGLAKTYQKKRSNPKPRKTTKRVQTSTRKTKKRGNPKASASTRKAARVYDRFHGRKPSRISTVRAKSKSLTRSSDYAKLGDLVSLLTPEGRIVFKEGERPILATDTAAKKLLFIGGNQDLSKMPMKRRNPSGLDQVGEVSEIEYFSRKKFDQFKPVVYYHAFGEVNGKRPTLLYDRKTKLMKLQGGDYKIKNVGIVN